MGAVKVKKSARKPGENIPEIQRKTKRYRLPFDEATVARLESYARRTEMAVPEAIASCVRDKLRETEGSDEVDDALARFASTKRKRKAS